MKKTAVVALCLCAAAARKASRETASDRIEKLLAARGGKKSADRRWATAVNTLKSKTRRLSGDDDGGDDDYVPNCPTQYAAWMTCIDGVWVDDDGDGTDDFFIEYSYSYDYSTTAASYGGCQPSTCNEAMAYAYPTICPNQPPSDSPAYACSNEYMEWQECEWAAMALENIGLDCSFTGICTLGSVEGNLVPCEADDDGDDDGDACLDDCSFTNDDDEVGWDCAGFTDIASSCLADCDASLANEFAFHCAEMYTKTLCYAEKTAAKTCACAELNVCDDSGITGYSLPSDAVNHGATNGGWCSGGVDDCSMDDDPEFDAAACWGLCALKYPDSLVAIDLNEGSCCCQDKCECMANIEDGNFVYTDASITTLPANCGDDDDAVGPLPAVCADAAADSEFIWECGGGPVYQQGCVDEWHAYVECKWNYFPAIVDGTYTSGPSCSLSCADALSSPAPAPAPTPRPADAAVNGTGQLGSDAAAARGPLLATAVLGAAAAAL